MYQISIKQYTLCFRQLSPSFLVVCLLVIASLLAGCSSPETPVTQLEPTEDEPIVETRAPSIDVEQSTIRLPDGSVISLAADSHIEIIEIDEVASGESGHEILLHSGKISIESKLPAGTWFTIFTRNYFLARVSGSIMMLVVDPMTGRFMIECIEGFCELGSDLQNLFNITETYKACLDQEGIFFGPFADITFGELLEICGTGIPVDTPTSEVTATYTPESTSTPDVEATATQSCIDFETENPGTPCP